ncbi:hypothetical protein J1N35_033999 [Gossypium stocksii]|uniref:Uncharacterized protein n=1 Tax=Gossypium stocksii TaxID=47602 RepID=A0A9D3US31_9ROSI|nr:hypothetical protein J1N35_033999 [Gossypium stocksii]
MSQHREQNTGILRLPSVSRHTPEATLNQSILPLMSQHWNKSVVASVLSAIWDRNNLNPRLDDTRKSFRLVENVEQLNETEPDEPKLEKLSNNSEPDADLANAPEKAESKGEPNNPKPRIESDVAKPVGANANPELTVSMTTPDKLEFSTMVDMWKIMHNQQ